MTQEDRRAYLIRYLLRENPQLAGMPIPEDEKDKKVLLRALFNIRMPSYIGEDFLSVQDEYLKEETRLKGITDIKDISPVTGDLYLWKGDITTLKCGAIVNAANSALLGCFYPNHGCIDNAIHTYAGVELRLFCNDLMKKQGHEEETGKAKITPAFNLPCKHIIHTVGPIVKGSLTKRDEKELASCYLSCLEIVEENDIDSIAFCCISTGEFHFPNERAAEIAVETVRKFKKSMGSGIKVIFNVFKETDYEIYRRLLKKD